MFGNCKIIRRERFKQAALYEYKIIFNSLNSSTALQKELAYIIQTMESQEPEINNKIVLQHYLELATELERKQCSICLFRLFTNRTISKH